MEQAEQRCPCCQQPVAHQRFLFDADSGVITDAGGKRCALTGQETRVFRALYEAKGRSLTKEAILNAIYHGRIDTAEIKIVDVFICKIRKKIKGMGIEIETCWGSGYRVAEVQPQ